MAQTSKRLGQNTNVMIGGKTFNSYDLSQYRQQTKAVNTVSGKENMPRSVRVTTVDNLAVQIQTSASGIRGSSASRLNRQSRSFRLRQSVPMSHLSPRSSASTSTRTNDREENAPGDSPYKADALTRGVGNGAKHFRTAPLSTLKTKAASAVQTGDAKAKAAELRIKQESLKLDLSFAGVVKSVGIQSRVSFNEALTQVRKHGAHSLVSNGTKDLSNAMHGTLAGSDDFGAQAAGGTMSAAAAAKSAYNVVQAAPGLVYDVGKNTLRAAIEAPGKIRNGVESIKTGGAVVADVIQSSVETVRDVKNGLVPVSDVLHRVQFVLKRNAIKGARFTAQSAVHLTVKGAIVGIPKITRLAGGVTLRAADALSQSDDMALQGAGSAIKLSRYGVKTAVLTGKYAGRTVKTSVKAGKSVVRAAAFVKNNGLRAAYARARQKAARGIANAGKSMFSALLNLIKVMGKKVVLPLILIVCVAVAAYGILATPVQAVGAIFGNIFNTTSVDEDGNVVYTEYDIREYLLNSERGIPALRTAYIQDLVDYIDSQFVGHGGSYHIVRLYTNLSDDVVGNSFSDIDSVFLSIDDLTNIIQPIFNAIILKDYELEPTAEQASDVLDEIFHKLFKIEEESFVEWCGNAISDGSGWPFIHDCGSIHAFWDCPNFYAGEHGEALEDYTCSLCCEIYFCGEENCPGHNMCSGYTYCSSHRVLKVTLTMDGIFQLLNEYFLEPIETLSNMASRTEAQEIELQNLKDYYEICLEYIAQVNVAYGGGMTIDDLSEIEFIYGSRSGNSAVVDLALSQVGNAGGQPYWSYYGFSSRVEWCACFVHWCYNVSGYGDAYGHSSNNAYTVTLVPYFKNRGDWQDSSYRDLAIGDVIFFDWDLDGNPNHVGLVIGRDAEYVYTVEGNSGDAVKVKCYSLSSSVILGYAVFNS